MKPRWFCLFLLLLPAILGAQESGFSIGLGAEADLITTDTWGIGGLFLLDYRFNKLFAVGAIWEVSYSHLDEGGNANSPEEFDTLLALEGDVFFRWYYVRFRYAHFFLQANLGVIATLRGSDVRDSRGSFEAGASTGVRFFLPRNWYIEIFARSGYPYLAGAGLLIGLRFPPKKTVTVVEKTVEVEVPVEVEKIVEVEVIVEVEKEIAESFSIFFGPNTATLTPETLSPELWQHNINAFDEVVKLLKENPTYRLLVEGHANPISRTRREEEYALTPLSQQRTQLVVERLVSRGIARNRLITFGSGGKRTVPIKADLPAGAQNRRVELYVIRDALINVEN